MDPGATRRGYLAKASDAEQAAARTEDVVAKAIWLQVAELYRQLARETSF